MSAAGLALVGTIWDIGTWYYSKGVQIFDVNENVKDDGTELSSQENLNYRVTNPKKIQ